MFELLFALAFTVAAILVAKLTQKKTRKQDATGCNCAKYDHKPANHSDNVRS